MTRYVVILFMVMSVAGYVCAQDAPKEPPQKEEQKEPEVSPELKERIEKLIKQLGDEDIQKRDAAQAELIKIGKPAVVPVEKAAKDTDDPEVRNRARAIVEELRPFTLIGKNEQGYEEYRHEKTGMVFVKIPGGTFKMGSEKGEEKGEYDEKPVHEVKLDGFLISKYEVTQAAWEKIMGNSPSQFKGDDNPVEVVSRNDCQDFCKETGLRLPTEAEWEYACRAGTTTEYYWGDESDGDYMWYDENSGFKTHPVGQKKPNGFGLYDMSGNVWEWCRDWYGEYAAGFQDNPTGPKTGEYRVVRGGSWRVNSNLCRTACRSFGYEPTECRGVLEISYYGFRCVVSQ